MLRERIEHSVGAPAKKMKSLTLHIRGCFRACLRDCLFLLPSLLLLLLFLFLVFSFYAVLVQKYCIVIVIISLFITLQLRADLQAYQPSRNIDYAWEGLTMTGTGIPAGTGRIG